MVGHAWTQLVHGTVTAHLDLQIHGAWQDLEVSAHQIHVIIQALVLITEHDFSVSVYQVLL